MTIRRRLLLLSALVLLPALLCAALGLYGWYREKVQRDSDNVLDIARVLSAVVERELSLRAATLHALALSPALTRGDLVAFRELAVAAAPRGNATITLRNTAGRRLVASPAGAVVTEPGTAQLVSPDEAPGVGAALFSGLYRAPSAGAYRFAVQVPVLRNDRPAYFLTSEIAADVLQQWLEAGKLRAGWTAAIVDRNGLVMACTLAPRDCVGQAADDALLRRVAQGESLSEISTFGGEPAITAITPIRASGWTLVVGMPKAALDRTVMGALQYTLAAAFLLFAIAVTAALWVGRSIARPVEELVRVAKAVGSKPALERPTTSLVEANLVAEQLVHANRRIHCANEVLERRIGEAVDESRRAQAALLDNQKLEALGRLTGGIAHDFNNLLQTINTSIEIGARFSNDDTIKAAMASARRAMQRATRVTRQLMTFARNAVSEPTVLDVRTAVTALQDLLGGALRRDIELRMDLSPELGHIRVDPVQLELAVLNLAINARDAMPGAGMFTITGENRQLPEGNAHALPSGDYVVLSFGDSGSGIPADVLPRVFEPFFTTKEVGKGSGLGLAQVYGFAKQCGGTATVESERGRGTCVELIIPRTAQQPARVREDGLRELPRIDAARKTVLFVEDDVLIAEVMRPALQAAGFNVLFAIDGAAAREVLRTASVDIVLSDIVMPGGMNGMELARYMQEAHPSVPVVLATGFSDAVPRSAPVRVLLKPYELHTAIDALVDELGKSSVKNTTAPSCTVH